METKLETLRLLNPWPGEKPDLDFNPGGWFPECNKQTLSDYLNEDTRLVVELGSWIGLSTRCILDLAPRAHVIAIDHWKGSPENEGDELLPILYDQFLANCWQYRDRLIPVKLTTEEGIAKLKELELSPDLIYVDAGHDYDSVCYDIWHCSTFGCPLVGDDFNANAWPDVVRAVWEEANNARSPLLINGSAWAIEKPDPPPPEPPPGVEAEEE